MFKILEAWTLAKSPTVGQLLRLFEEVGVDRSNIEEKYELRAVWRLRVSRQYFGSF